MNNLLNQTLRFISFLFIQVYVLNQVTPLHQFVVPYIYFLFILWLPFSMTRSALSSLGFFFGLTLDFFTKTPGLHAAACTLIAFLRPPLIDLLISQEGADQNYPEPTVKSMGYAPYATYIVVLTFIHHVFLIFLEWMQFGSFLFFVGKVLGTTGVSLLLVLITELLFFRKQGFRTNTA